MRSQDRPARAPPDYRMRYSHASIFGRRSILDDRLHRRRRLYRRRRRRLYRRRRLNNVVVVFTDSLAFTVITCARVSTHYSIHYSFARPSGTYSTLGVVTKYHNYRDNRVRCRIYSLHRYVDVPFPDN